MSSLPILFPEGDLAPRLIDELAALVDEVFVPLLSNPLNHEGWPLVVSQDILKQIHNLKSTVYEVRDLLLRLTFITSN